MASGVPESRHMQPDPVVSDFEFKDDRSYVHGSTLVEWCWKVATEHGGAGAWPRPRVDATFVRWAWANGRFWLGRAQSDLPPRQRLSTLFHLYDVGRHLWLGFEEDRSLPVSRRVRTERRIEDCRLSEPFSGTCQISAATLTVLLENVLEANKRIHLMSVATQPAPSVINAFMRAFPLQPTRDEALVSLKILNTSRRQLGDSVATLARLTCAAIDPEPFEIAYVLRPSEAS
jgi:hypothetical protein